MLKLANEFGTDFRVLLLISGFMAYDEQTGIYMRRSHGNPAFGNPTKYFLGGIDRAGMRDEQLAAWAEPPVPWGVYLSSDDWPLIRAYTDADAVRQANVWIARKIKGAGLDVKVIYAKLDASALTLRLGSREGFEPFGPFDLDGFREYVAANRVERVVFDFYGRWPKRSVAADKMERHAAKLYRLLPEWEREAEVEAASERKRELALASYERARQAGPTIRATPPRKDAAVEVEHPRAPRLYSYMRVTGPREEVYAYLSHVFSTDSCTPCYEHMLWHLNALDELPDGRVSAFLYKSHYAGD